MTLEQVFPNLPGAIGGAIVAPIDGFLDVKGPARAMTTEWAMRIEKDLSAQILAIDPTSPLPSFQFPSTAEGQARHLDHLRFKRAEAFMRVRGELRPLQVETLRFIQNSTDRAYERGLKLLRAGKLPIRLSEQEALGNYIDAEVRRELRNQYNIHNIPHGGRGPVRVNRREDDTSGTDLTFRRPDARVGDVAFDVTLAMKSMKTPQVRGFFSTDFEPVYVIIVRPRQLGSQSTYAIRNPRGQR